MFARKASMGVITNMNLWLPIVKVGTAIWIGPIAANDDRFDLANDPHLSLVSRPFGLLFGMTLAAWSGSSPVAWVHRPTPLLQVVSGSARHSAAGSTLEMSPSQDSHGDDDSAQQATGVIHRSGDGMSFRHQEGRAVSISTHPALQGDHVDICGRPDTHCTPPATPDPSESKVSQDNVNSYFTYPTCLG
jgi:hypothetical protein